MEKNTFLIMTQSPMYFSVITFPFLFGGMFRDVGHGNFMLLFVLFLIWKENDFRNGGLNEMVQMCFDGRSIILLLALFPIYNGFLYNKFFFIPMTICSFPNCSMWIVTNGSYLMELNDNGFVYPFGIDPAWKGSENKLYYYNSLKVMSVLIEVMQMLVGIEWTECSVPSQVI